MLYKSSRYSSNRFLSIGKALGNLSKNHLITVVYDEFLVWYNQRLHGSLWLEIGESPQDALIRKLEQGVLLGMFMRWNE